MPKVAGTYHAVVRVKKVVAKTESESKEAAIRAMLIMLASQEDRTDFEDWVNGGMEIELVPTAS